MINISDMCAPDTEEVLVIENEAFSLPWSGQSFLDAIQNENAVYLVIKEDERVCGYLGMWYGGTDAEITNVAVLSGDRGRGFGKMLLAAAYDRARADGMEKMFLEVRVSNDIARNMYEKFGFEHIGIRKNFYEKPVEDGYVLRRVIKNQE